MGAAAAEPDTTTITTIGQETLVSRFPFVPHKETLSLSRSLASPTSRQRRRRRRRLPSGLFIVNCSEYTASAMLLFRLMGVLLLALSRCRSEAFAHHSSSFFGTTISTSTNRMARIRGGSSSETAQNSNNNIVQPITCVMQAPSPIYNNLNNSHNKKNGRSMPDLTGNYNNNNMGEWNAHSTNNNKMKKNNNMAMKMKSSHNSKQQLHQQRPQQQQQSMPLEYVAETALPTELGLFRLKAYRMGDTEPCVIYSANHPLPNDDDNQRSSSSSSSSSIPVRVHDQCMTSEVFGSQRCDCKEQLEMAMQYISQHGGCIIYLQQEGRGIGLANKIAAYALQDLGLDTVDANLHLGFPEDMRVYDVVPLILQHLQISSIQLLTNNPRKVQELQNLDIVVESTIPMVVPNSNQHNHKYLMTKRDRMDHDNLEQLAMSRRQSSPAFQTMTPRRTYHTYYNGSEPGPTTANGPNGRSALQEFNTQKTKDGQPLQTTPQQLQPQQQEGVIRQSDGYCFGKQTVLDAIDAIRRGEMVVVVDDMDRENEGDFIMAADACTPEKMAEIIRYSSGVICVAMEQDRLEKLQLPSMVQNNQDPKGTAFAVSVDATKVHGIVTGISATDRSKTVQLLASDRTTAEDFARPGHLFPLRAQPGGVLTRDGHTEATVDLARLAGRPPVGVLCEIVSEDHPTEMMRLPEMKRFVKERGYVLTSIADLIQYRKETGQ